MGKMVSGSRRVVVVLVTCPTRTAARKVANRLIGSRLAACVNLIPSIESTFRWQGKTERCREALLLIKTTARRFEALKRAILTLHPYQVPEIIAVSLAAGHQPYLDWVASSASSP